MVGGIENILILHDFKSFSKNELKSKMSKYLFIYFSIYSIPHLVGSTSIKLDRLMMKINKC